MSGNNSGPDLLNDLAHEFAQRYRRGERPSLTEYIDRHPELAVQIQELFPALVVIEEFGSVAGQPPGPDGRSPGDSRKVPERLGEYRILREIGRGGMGIVYEAVQESLGRHVALKVLPFHNLISPTQRERFDREARAAARLHHTNIVPVFGIGEHEGMHYYAMQFIQGQGLDTVLREVKHLRTGRSPPQSHALTISIAHNLRTNQFDGSKREAGSGGPGSEPSAGSPEKKFVARSAALVVPLERSHTSGLTGSSEAQYFRGVARIGVQVAEALAYTHQQGLAHRDIKPSNLLLDTQGVVWITDFGLVKDEASDNLTSPGDLLGTLRYMAPERLHDGGDSRSDLYGLGATLYEMLTLQSAFADAPRARLMDRILHEEPTRPRKLDPHIPRDLETVVLKALAKEPGQRYQTAGELAEDLRRFLSDRPIKARRSSPVERTWRWCRRNPAVAALGVFAALLLVVIAAVKSASVIRLQEQLERTERAEAEKTEKLWDSYLAHAQASRWSGRMGRRFEGLEAVAKAAAIRPDLRLRNEAIALFTLPDMRPFKQLPEGIPAANTALAFDQGFERYVCSDNQGNLSVRWLADNREIAAFPGSGKHAFFLKFSPDSRFLAAVYHVENALRIWDISRRKMVLNIPMGVIVDFGPKSGLAALVARGGCVILYDLISGKETRRLPVGAGIAYCSLHPDGRLLAVSTQEHPHSRIFDLDTGKVIRTLSQNGTAIWNADGTVLALIASEGISVWNARTWTQQAVLKTPDSHTAEAAFDYQSDLLASRGWDNILRVWDPMTGRQLLSQHGARGILQFSRDGRLLGGTFDGSKYQIWEVTRSFECRPLCGAPAKDQVAADACFSADGRLLVSGFGDGARLWDLALGRAVALLDTAGICGAALFLADGSVITSSPAGLLRWPVRANRVDTQAGGASAEMPARGLAFGPPQRLLSLDQTGFYGAYLCPDGKVATLERAKGQLIVVDPHNPSARQVLPGHRNVYSGLAVSPDGRWLAASTLWDLPQDKLRISDLRTGQIAWTLHERVTGAFSPDGKWLVTAGGRCRLWEVGSWSLARAIPQDAGLGDTTAAAFTSDGAVLAIAYEAKVIRLIDPGSGQELATLAAPESQGQVTRLSFSPDGSQLAGVFEKSGVQLWDLRLIRQELAELGLDWDLPPYKAMDGSPAKPLRVIVENAN